MPKQVQFTKERIISEAIEIIRKDGIGALTARSLGKKLGCSVAPIFRTYANMEELAGEVRLAATGIVYEKLAGAVKYEPAFKEFGLRLVRLSKEDPKLFHYIFLEKDVRCDAVDDLARECLTQSERIFSITKEQSMYIYEHVWPHVLGLSQLCCKKPDIFTDECISKMLSTQFQALLSLVKSGQEVKDVKPHLIADNNCR